MAAVALVLTSAGVAHGAPPTCVAPSPQTVAQGSFLSIDAGTLCSDPEGSPLSFEVSTPPAHGLAGVVGTLLGYSPEAGYVGPDAFAFTASDGTEISQPVTVSITVAPNPPPSCPASTPFEAEPDTPTSFEPRAACHDDGFIAGGAIVAQPQHGTLAAFDPLAGFVYTPAAGYRGPDAFTVTVTDDAGQVSGEMLVEVTVLGPNRVPTCVTPVTVRVPAGGRATLDHRNTCTDPDGDTMSPLLVTPPAHGHFELGPTGIVDFVADPGYVGTDRFVYRVEDRRGGLSNDAVIDLVIGDPPTGPSSPPPPLPDVAGPALKVGRSGAQTLAAVRRRGLELLLTSAEAGTVTIELSVSKRTARRVKIKRNAKGPVVVGRANGLLHAGDNEVAVRLSRRAKRRLRRVERLTLLVSATARDRLGNTSQAKLRVKLRR
jgi:hypothetical protein